MPTIEIPDIPENAYEVLRLRARADGRSIEAYVRQQLIDMAAAPTKAEHLAVVKRSLRRSGTVVPTAEQIMADVDADRR